MARKTTKATESKAADAKASAKEEPKYGVADLVAATELQPASVRVALRELNVEKNFGNKYGWKTKKDFDEVVKAMKERSAKRVVGSAPAAEKAPAEKAPAKKAPAKRAPRKKAETS